MATIRGVFRGVTSSIDGSIFDIATIEPLSIGNTQQPGQIIRMGVFRGKLANVPIGSVIEVEASELGDPDMMGGYRMDSFKVLR